MKMDIRKELSDLYKIFSYCGWDDAIFTHISARIPDTDYILMKPFSLMFDEVTPDSLIKFHISDIKDCSNTSDVNEPGWNIHAAVHKERKDAHYIAHVHTSDIVCASACKDGLYNISQYTSLITARGLAYHEYEGVATEESEGKRIVENLGNKTILLMKNHGSLVLGSSAQDVLFWQYMLQRACEVQTKINDINSVEHIGAERKQIKPVHGHPLGTPPTLLWNAFKRKIL